MTARFRSLGITGSIVALLASGALLLPAPPAHALVKTWCDQQRELVIEALLHFELAAAIRIAEASGCGDY
jgi:hypothetical protein